MSNKMELTVGEMQKTARGLEDEILTWEKKVGEIYTLVGELNTMWEGPDKSAFVKTFDEDSAKYKELGKLMSDFKVALGEIIKEIITRVNNVGDIVKSR